MPVATLDATPLLGRRTGIGRYVHHLLAALPGAAERQDLDLQIQVMTWSARRRNVPDLPARVHQVGPRVPARALRSAWVRGDHPSSEVLGVRGDLWHGTNFVVPPSRRARPILTVHDLSFLDQANAAPQSLAYARLVPRALRRGAHVLTPTHAVAEAVRSEYSLPADRVTVTPLGVGSEWFAEPDPLSGEAPAGLRATLGTSDYVIFVGSLEPRKNLSTLVRAHQALRRDDPSAPDLVLAGPAGSRPLPPDLATVPGLHRTGWVSDEQLRALVARSRALVLPSTDEGFGLPVLEALASGRPVVTSDIPALREVAGPHGDSASPFDVDGLADALSRALNRLDDAEARSARSEWARRWTWQSCADATVGAYHHVLGDSH